MSAPQKLKIMGEKNKRKRVNKNKKKNWIKHIDITDVEKHLQQKRKQEILGDLEHVEDKDLFFVSKKPEDEVPQKKSKVEYFKCYSHLQNTSAVKDPLIKRNRVKDPEEFTTEWVKRLKKEAELTKPSKLTAVKQRKAVYKLNKNRRKQKKVEAAGARTFFDPWEKNDDCDSGIGEELYSYYLEETCQKPHKRKEFSKVKPSLLPACEVPLAGASYNPTEISHNKLLKKATDLELKKIKKERAIEQNTTAMFPTRDQAPTEETWLKEMSGCLFEDSDEKEEAVEESETELGLCNPPIRDEDRKTRKKKRIEQKQRINKIKAERLKTNRQEESQVFRVHSINKELNEQEKKYAKRKSLKRKKMELKKYQPQKLSRYDYEAPDLEVNLTDEIQRKLMLVKTEGDLLEDRYKSLQKRNIIEPRIRQKIKRKYKLKKFKKDSTKTPREKDGYQVQTKLGKVTIKI